MQQRHTMLQEGPPRSPQLAISLGLRPAKRGGPPVLLPTLGGRPFAPPDASSVTGVGDSSFVKDDVKSLSSRDATMADAASLVTTCDAIALIGEEESSSRKMLVDFYRHVPRASHESRAAPRDSIYHRLLINAPFPGSTWPCGYIRKQHVRTKLHEHMPRIRVFEPEDSGSWPDTVSLQARRRRNAIQMQQQRQKALAQYTPNPQAVGHSHGPRALLEDATRAHVTAIEPAALAAAALSIELALHRIVAATGRAAEIRSKSQRGSRGGPQSNDPLETNNAYTVTLADLATVLRHQADRPPMYSALI
eukprot:Polyplicarium_translucidae@DN4632_c0_g1_i1.p1